MRPSELAKLTADELAVSIKPILTELLQRSSQGYSAETTETYNLLASRAAEPAVVAAITYILMPHPGDHGRVTQTIQGHIIYYILIKLPFEQLQAYQNTVAAVNAQNTEASKVKPDFYLDNMKRLERFMVEPEAVWVAEDWLDFVGFRTLADRVHTAEQMRPYMRELYHWLVDSGLPDSYSQKQLARFPETTAAVAAEIIDDVVAGKEALSENVGSLDKMVSNVLFVYVPMGKDWVRLRKPIESLTQVLKEVVKKGGWDDYESCLEACEEWLYELDKWERDESEEE